MSGIDTAIALVQRDLAMCQVAQKLFRGDGSARVAKLTERLTKLQTEREQIHAEYCAAMRRREAGLGVTRPEWGTLVPLGMDEHVGTGSDHGFIVDNEGKRTRPL